MQMLFQADIGHQTPDEVRATFWKAGDPVEPEVRAYAEDLFLIAQEQQPKIDGLIAEHSAHWRLERMPAVDRNLLRLSRLSSTRPSRLAAATVRPSRSISSTGSLILLRAA
jgi:N utilization substance protein B